MTAVDFDDGTVKNIGAVESMTKVWIGPATGMGSSDTVVFPTVTDATLRILACRDNTTGDDVTATVSSYTVTFDAGEGDFDHVYVLTYIYEQS